MSGRGEEGRRSRGGLRLPRGVGGLLEAMRALARGDSRPTDGWDRGSGARS